MLHCLKTKVDASTLMLKSLENASAWVPYIDNNSAIRDPFMPDSPLSMIQQTKIEAEAVIIGHASEEGLVHMAPFIKNTALYANFSASLPGILFERSDINDAHIKVAQLLKRYLMNLLFWLPRNFPHLINLLWNFSSMLGLMYQRERFTMAT